MPPIEASTPSIVCHIGTHAFVGGASAIKKDIAPFTRGQGNPYKTVGLNSVGLTRKGFSNQSVAAIKEMYNLFYRKGLNTSQALAVADSRTDLLPEQQTFVEFVRSADRGLLPEAKLPARLRSAFVIDRYEALKT